MPGRALSEFPPEQEPATVPGWFGKVVMLGDFAHRRLTPEFIEACDHWLSSCISASRTQLGDRWLDTYLTAPLWRFAWAPGVVGEFWWFGVLTPSVDAVGRYFPLVVALPNESAPLTADALEALADWYSHNRRAALATLNVGASLESFEAELQRSPALRAVTSAPAHVEWKAGRTRHVLQGRASLADWAQALAGPPVVDKYAGHSFWLRSIADDLDSDESNLTVVVGLPEPDQFALMLEGRW